MLSTACATERIVEKPVPVPGPETIKYLDVPAQHLIQRKKSDIPDSLNYGDGLRLWNQDRLALDKVNGQLQAIESLATKTPLD